MQPLKLPPSSMGVSPSDNTNWKTWDAHLNHSHTPTTNLHCHTTANYNNVSVPHITYNHTGAAPMIYDDLQSLQSLPNSVYPSIPYTPTPQAQTPLNPAMDPYTYSQLLYQSQFQNLLCAQQAHQAQSRQIHHQISQLQSLQIQNSPIKSHTSSPLKSPQKSISSDISTDTAIINKTCIEKIFLNAKFVTPEVFRHLSVEIPKLSQNDLYSGFFVAPNPTGYEWDMVLKVYYTNKSENKTHIKYYLVHQEFALTGERCAKSLLEASQTKSDCVQFELEMPVELFNEFDHCISYMYGNDVYIGDTHLIAMHVLNERLGMSGGIIPELLYEIRRCCDKFHCVSFLLQSEALLCEELVWLCGDSILQNLSTISYYEWLSIPDTAFNRLIFQAVSGGIDKYSDFIVCELIMQYIKAVMSESHITAKAIIKGLDSTDIKCVSISHALPLLKICDVLFAEFKHKWRMENLTVYKLSLRKISAEFTPYHNELCQQLQGLSPITFASILISATHLLRNALKLALMAYKDGNHAAYYNDKHLRIARVLEERQKLPMKERNFNKECSEFGEKLSLVSPLALEDTSLPNFMTTSRSRSPPKSPTKSPRTPKYSVSGDDFNELSPRSVSHSNNSQSINLNIGYGPSHASETAFVYDTPLPNRAHALDIEIANVNVELENALICNIDSIIKDGSQ